MRYNQQMMDPAAAIYAQNAQQDINIDMPPMNLSYGQVQPGMPHYGAPEP
jgi:hypothetical protein